MDDFTAAVTPTSVNANKNTDATVSCEISQITTKVSVAWKDGDTPIITEDDKYEVVEGDLNTDKQTSTLKVFNVQSDRTFTCIVTSGEYPISGPFDGLAKIKMFGKTFQFCIIG